MRYLDTEKCAPNDHHSKRILATVRLHLSILHPCIGRHNVKLVHSYFGQLFAGIHSKMCTWRIVNVTYASSFFQTEAFQLFWCHRCICKICLMNCSSKRRFIYKNRKKIWWWQNSFFESHLSFFRHSLRWIPLLNHLKWTKFSRIRYL